VGVNNGIMPHIFAYNPRFYHTLRKPAGRRRKRRITNMSAVRTCARQVQILPAWWCQYMESLQRSLLGDRVQLTKRATNQATTFRFHTLPLWLLMQWYPPPLQFPWRMKWNDMQLLSLHTTIKWNNYKTLAKISTRRAARFTYTERKEPMEGKMALNCAQLINNHTWTLCVHSCIFHLTYLSLHTESIRL
jgi:hypothetical protein